jgi:hypothetical protein
MGKCGKDGGRSWSQSQTQSRSQSIVFAVLTLLLILPKGTRAYELHAESAEGLL